MELEGFCNRLSNLGYSLLLTDKAKEFIADAGCDVQYGARPLKRAIQHHLEDEIAELILKGEISQGNTIIIDYDNSAKKIVASTKE